MIAAAAVAIGYVEASAASVPFRFRRAAQSALAYARRDLALPPLAMSWYDVAAADDPAVLWVTRGTLDAGRCLGDTTLWIWTHQLRRVGGLELVLRFDPATPARVAAVVLHEASHARDALRGLPPSTAESEGNAAEYERQHRKLTERIGSGWTR